MKKLSFKLFMLMNLFIDQGTSRLLRSIGALWWVSTTQESSMKEVLAVRALNRSVFFTNSLAKEQLDLLHLLIQVFRELDQMVIV